MYKHKVIEFDVYFIVITIHLNASIIKFTPLNGGKNNNHHHHKWLKNTM